MENSELTMRKETVKIEGDRNLYSYTFEAATSQSRLIAMIEGRELGVVGAYLDRNSGLDLTEALRVAKELDHREAIAEIERRLGA